MALRRCCSSISSLLTLKHSVTLCASVSTTRGEGTGGKEERRVGRKKKSPFARTKIPGWSPYKPDKVNPDAPWPSVFQTARPYDPYIIPLPIRMGRPDVGVVSPPAVGNLELLKVPNFFHLTPPAIEAHCNALKPLCTPWPSKLPNLPLRVETRNYVLPGNSLYHSGARRVRLKVALKDLTLTDRARQKLISLCGPRYDPETDVVTLVGKRCPTRKQNHEYVLYLLKVLYLEASLLGKQKGSGKLEVLFILKDMKLHWDPSDLLLGVDATTHPAWP